MGTVPSAVDMPQAGPPARCIARRRSAADRNQAKGKCLKGNFLGAMTLAAIPGDEFHKESAAWEGLTDL